MPGGNPSRSIAVENPSKGENCSGTASPSTTTAPSTMEASSPPRPKSSAQGSGDGSQSTVCASEVASLAQPKCPYTGGPEARLYRYTALAPGNIRLLRVMAGADRSAALQCHLFDYPLGEQVKEAAGTGKRSHLFEALSYVWGRPNGLHYILVDGLPLGVTASLHSALAHLRDDRLDRVLWADAVCINQGDDREKERQIQLMAEIYRSACRVVVWLGEPEGMGDQALEAMMGAIEELPSRHPWRVSEEMRQAIRALFQRPWFERIWVSPLYYVMPSLYIYISPSQVLQEVAAARSIVVKCGAAEVDGHGFGVAASSPSFDHIFEPVPDLAFQIRPVIYLMRGAAFRGRHGGGGGDGDGSSLGIRPLAELVDMYRSHKATVRHDKIFALLGMRSDRGGGCWLIPDYTTPWETLLRRLVHSVLDGRVAVQTWPDKEVAVISGEGFVVGRVVAIKHHNRGDQQRVEVQLRNVVGGHPATTTATDVTTAWNLPPSAAPVQMYDVVFLFRGAEKPTLVRFHNSQLYIVMVAVPYKLQLDEPGPQRATQRPVIITWDWHVGLPPRPDVVVECEIESAERLLEVAAVLDDAGNYDLSIGILSRVMEDAEQGINGLCVWQVKESLAEVMGRAQQWPEARRLLRQVMQAREAQAKQQREERSDGKEDPEAHPRIERSRDLLLSLYRDQGHLLGEKLEAIEALLSTDRRVARTEADMVQFVARHDEEVVDLLLELGGVGIAITEHVLVAAAGNTWRGEAVMRRLLDRAEVAKLLITEAIVAAAAGNEWQGRHLIKLLLERRQDQVKITKAVLRAAKNNALQGQQVLALLGHKNARGGIRTAIQLTITTVLLAAVGNWPSAAKLENVEKNKRNNTGVAQRASNTGLLVLPPPVQNWEVEGKSVDLQ